jgi:ACS family glucarate transporter-like MFS transporter
VLLNRDILLITVSYFCMNYVFYIFFNWFFIYLIEVRDFAILEGGWLNAAPWIAGSVGAVAGGLACDRLCDRIGPRWGCRIPALIGLLLAGTLVLLGAIAANPYAAVALLALGFGCTQLTEGAYWQGTIFVARRHAAAACGVLNTGGNLVGGVVALLVPLTVETLGWIPALATGSAFAVVGALIWLTIRPDQPLSPP